MPDFLTNILGWVIGVLGVFIGAFTAGHYREKAKRRDKNIRIMNEAMEAAENAEAHAREDLKKVEHEIANSDFSDLGR